MYTLFSPISTSLTLSFFPLHFDPCSSWLSSDTYALIVSLVEGVCISTGCTSANVDEILGYDPSNDPSHTSTDTSSSMSCGSTSTDTSTSHTRTEPSSSTSDALPVWLVACLGSALDQLEKEGLTQAMTDSLVALARQGLAVDPRVRISPAEVGQQLRTLLGELPRVTRQPVAQGAPVHQRSDSWHDPCPTD